MARDTKNLTKRTVDALSEGVTLFDASVSGFGVRRQKGPGRTFFVKYRSPTGGRQRWYRIGRYGAPWTVEMARDEAKKVLGRVAAGEDPAHNREEDSKRLTVSELCDHYLKHGCGDKKESTLSVDRGRITRHIKPLLGKRLMHDITRAEVERFKRDVAEGKTAIDEKTGKRGRAIVTGGKGVASKCLNLLSAMFNYAKDRGLVDSNPVDRVKRYAENKNERFLTTAEMGAIGAAINELAGEGVNPVALDAIRLLMLSGSRKGEILGLRWSEVDFENSCIRKRDSKTGAKVIRLGAAALALVSGLPRFAGCDYVFPNRSCDGPLVGLQKVWAKVRENAGLPDVRVHDLRHTFASVAASGGDSLLIIGKLLGHTQQATTQRYAHLQNDPVRNAADRIASEVAAAMERGSLGKVVNLKGSAND